ncbi:hypothetical protein N7474_001935 [Penicillium riverlandense]|uniref:uncharacterized protein n=1 Tax=Penicillium riverlandense TaxID=1903569 RepID=UPI002549A8F3|nr:uncharacterized protein N7474_001935 [Penicillium riverlandense]KAJ5833624.1 hypothetical protein N7474_001935 [Penicillium riverlandense]
MEDSTSQGSPSSSVRSTSRARRSWTVSADTEAILSSGRSNGQSSVGSSIERPKTQDGEAGDSVKAGSSSFSKLLNARRRRKERKNSQKPLEDLPPVPSGVVERALQASRSNESRGSTSATSSSSVTVDSVPPEGDVVNLLTDDSEPDKTPPLTSHNSHTGFYTLSSPLIKTASVDPTDTDRAHADVDSVVSGPSGTGSESNTGESLPRSATQATLEVPTDSNGKRRASTTKRFKEAISATQDKKSANEDSERASSKSGGARSGRSLFSSRRSSLSSKRAQPSPEPVPPIPAPIRTDITEEKPVAEEKPPSPGKAPSKSPLPTTPRQPSLPAPETTVTPPTPTENRLLGSPTMPNVSESPESIKPRNSFSSAGITVSPSGNMISHRRVRSASAAHAPSKLSTSTSLSPLEEAKPLAHQQSGFFSSVFSVAQNAASSLSNTLSTQQKNRAVSQTANASANNPFVDSASDEADKTSSKSEEGKSTTVETLGAGDLSFSHLDIDAPPGEVISTTDGVVITKPDSPIEKRRNTAVYQRDAEAAKLEDKRAARAVHMAYEKPSEPAFTGPTIEDALDLQSTVSFPGDGTITGDHTPPTGSIIDGDLGGIKRTGSVRSRQARRHRGSSGATGSTIAAAAAGASTLALGVSGANSSVPRLTGFAVASKKRNRDFHQLFRSVPEDDYLIEDYSCALQREIILAGRIYVSEGHICFSSNILGWVTTLVISFDEVVAVEKENTAMVFPNAIAIQTLHARHTFRSLLSRESTYDLMVNIWKINHPSLKSSVNGTRVAGTGDKTEKVGDGDSDSETEVSDEDDIYDEDEEDDNADSLFGAGDASMNGSSVSLPAKGRLSRQTSGLLLTANGSPPAAGSNGEGKNGTKSSPAKDAENDFPGPPTHPPTEYTESDGQYEKIIKDEVIPAPLGKVYSLVFGPASGGFMTKFLVENQKSGELQFEGGLKGLTNESRIRKYSYIKPLPGSIGPRQTKCISTENLDFLDLEKAVLVTLTTQTPDVPSGNVFSTKTKYLFTWAGGNQMRFLMTCTIEWTGKSWLKGPIEKGAIDGQTTFGNELVKALKMGVVPRGRAATGRTKGRRKKGDGAAREASGAASLKAAADANAAQAQSWGLFEPVRSILEPFASLFKPLWSGNIAILVIGILLYMVFFRSPSGSSMLSHDVGCPGHNLPQRLAAYEEMWRREESELWTWLEDRVGMDGMVFPNVVTHRSSGSPSGRRSSRFNGADERELNARLREERVSDREMDHAIRTTRQRLDVLEEMISKNKERLVVDEEAFRSEL